MGWIHGILSEQTFIHRKALLARRLLPTFFCWHIACVTLGLPVGALDFAPEPSALFASSDFEEASPPSDVPWSHYVVGLDLVRQDILHSERLKKLNLPRLFIIDQVEPDISRLSPERVTSRLGGSAASVSPSAAAIVDRAYASEASHATRMVHAIVGEGMGSSYLGIIDKGIATRGKLSIDVLQSEAVVVAVGAVIRSSRGQEQSVSQFFSALRDGHHAPQEDARRLIVFGAGLNRAPLVNIWKNVIGKRWHNNSMRDYGLLVGSIDPNGMATETTPFPDRLDILAPNVDVLATLTDSQRDTSYAAAFVAGVLADLTVIVGRLSLREARHLLSESAFEAPHGKILNAYRLFLWAERLVKNGFREAPSRERVLLLRDKKLLSFSILRNDLIARAQLASSHEERLNLLRREAYLREKPLFVKKPEPDAGTHFSQIP